MPSDAEQRRPPITVYILFHEALRVHDIRSLRDQAKRSSTGLISDIVRLLSEP